MGQRHGKMDGDRRVVITKTPFRISFAGGGTDIPEYYKNFGTGAVVSGAMNRYMYVTASQYFFDDRIRIHYVRTENDISEVDDIQHPSIRECLKFTRITRGIQISSIADIPSKGTGVGSSSSFAVGLLNALHNWRGESVNEQQLAKEAIYIERTALKEAGGKQDQYVAAFGGLLLMEFFKDDTVKVRKAKIKKKDVEELQKHLLLMYTGRERSSSAIHVNQAKEVGSHLDSYRKMCELAYRQFEALEDGRWWETGKLMHENWQIKKTLANGISDQHVDKIYETAMKNGADGGKIMGAGGGGFFLFFADPDRHQKIIDAIPELKQERICFEQEGSRIIYNQGNPVKAP